MNNFKQCKISDIANKIAMGPFGSNIKVSTFVESGVPVISGMHLKGFYLSEESFNYITKEHADRLKNSIVYPGDIIFTHAGNVGQVAMIPAHCHYPYYMLSQRQFYLRCDKEKVFPEFIVYYLHSHEGQGKLLANVSQVGVPSIAQPSSFLKTIEIPLPSIPEQKKIISILDSISNKIELNIQTKIWRHRRRPSSSHGS
ncbi:MAG: restriction endonuclease subunit S [Victivallaceae bacterium]|nr:restriction endonuclease subunit S [Victivallaceae bacterium]